MLYPEFAIWKTYTTSQTRRLIHTQGGVCEMGAGFSRACLEKSSRVAVRPQEKNCEENKWVAGIGEDGEEILEDVLEEPDNAGVDDANMGGKIEYEDWEIHYCRARKR